MSDFKQEFKEGVFEFGLDSDNDGAMSIKGKLYLNEAVAEAFKKGEKLEGAKIVDFGFNGLKFVVSVDTDQDGQKMFELELDLPEGLDEGTQRI